MIHETLLLCAAVRHNVTRRAILAPTRGRSAVSRARAWYIVELRKRGFTSGQIARWTGRDPGTVFYHVRKAGL